MITCFSKPGSGVIVNIYNIGLNKLHGMEVGILQALKHMNIIIFSRDSAHIISWVKQFFK